MDAGDMAALDAWYPVGSPIDIRRSGMRRTPLFGRTIDLSVHRTWISPSIDGHPLPVTERLGLVWTTLGRPNWPPPSIIEYYEIDRGTLNVSSRPLDVTGPEIVARALRMLQGPRRVSQDPSIPDHASVAIRDDDGDLVFDSDRADLGIMGAGRACRARGLGPHSAVFLFPPTRPTPAPREDFYAVFCQPRDSESTLIHHVAGFVDTPSIVLKAMSEGYPFVGLDDGGARKAEHAPPSPDRDADPHSDIGRVFRAWLETRVPRNGAEPALGTS